MYPPSSPCTCTHCMYMYAQHVTHVRGWLCYTCTYLVIASLPASYEYTVSSTALCSLVTQCVLPIPLQFFTSFPPLALGLFDQDVSYRRRLLKPQLYWASQENSAYNTKVRGQQGRGLYIHVHVHVHAQKAAVISNTTMLLHVVT